MRSRPDHTLEQLLLLLAFVVVVCVGAVTIPFAVRLVRRGGSAAIAWARQPPNAMQIKGSAWLAGVIAIGVIVGGLVLRLLR